MTYNERLLWLAGLEINGWPRFPSLRSQCRLCGGEGKVTATSSSYLVRQCTICQGRGWMPVDDLGCILFPAHAWRFEKRKGGDVSATCQVSAISLVIMAQGATYKEAAIQALFEAVKKEQP